MSPKIRTELTGYQKGGVLKNNIPSTVTFQSIYDNKDSRTKLYWEKEISQFGVNNLGIHLWSSVNPQDVPQPDHKTNYVGKMVDLKNTNVDSLFVEVINNILLQLMEPFNLHCVNYIGAYCNHEDTCVSFTTLAGSNTLERTSPQHAFQSLPLFLSRFSTVGRKYGLTHNDLHSANIMLGNDNILRMIDYGRVHMFKKPISGKFIKGLKGFNGIALIVNMHFGNRLRNSLKSPARQGKIHYRDVLALNQNNDYYIDKPWKTSDGKHYLNYMFDVANLCLNVFDKLDDEIPKVTQRLLKFTMKTSPYQSSVAVSFQGMSFRNAYDKMLKSSPKEYVQVFQCILHGLEFFCDYLHYSITQVYGTNPTQACKLLAVGIESVTWKFIDIDSKKSFIKHISKTTSEFDDHDHDHDEEKEKEKEKDGRNLHGGFQTKPPLAPSVSTKNIKNLTNIFVKSQTQTVKNKTIPLGRLKTTINPLKISKSTQSAQSAQSSKWDLMFEESTKVWNRLSDDIHMNRIDKQVLEKSNEIIKRTFSEPNIALHRYLQSEDRTQFIKHMKEEQKRLKSLKKQ